MEILYGAAAARSKSSNDLSAQAVGMVNAGKDKANMRTITLSGIVGQPSNEKRKVCSDKTNVYCSGDEKGRYKKVKFDNPRDGDMIV